MTQRFSNDHNPVKRQRLLLIIVIGVAAVLVAGAVVRIVAPDQHPFDNVRLAWEENRRALDNYRRTWDNQRRAREEKRRAEKDSTKR
jgi:hypothetical protein